MKQITQINAFSLAKVQALIFTILGLFNSVLYTSVLYTVVLVFDRNIFGRSSAVRPGKLGIGMVLMFIFIPVFYTVIGYVSGLVIGTIYNLIAKHFGGVKVKIE